MQIIIKTKNIALDPVSQTLESFITKKIGGLGKFIKGFEKHTSPVPGGRQLFDIFVEVGRETNHHRKGMVYKTELKLYLPGKALFVKAMAEDVSRSVLDARDEMEQEIRKYKSKIMEFPRRQAKKSGR